MNKKVFTLFHLLFLVLIITGCGKKESKIVLDTPNITLDNNYIVIDNVTNANEFNIYINGVRKDTISITSYDLSYLEDGCYSVCVSASGDKELYIE